MEGNISKEDTTKEKTLKKIFDTIDIENERQNQLLLIKHENLNQKISNLQSSLFNKLKQKCKVKYDWFISNGGQITEDSQTKVISMNIPDTIANDNNLVLMKDCFNQQSKEITEFFGQMNEKFESNITYKENCIGSCVMNISESLEKDLKVCIKGCLQTSFEDMNKYYDKIDKKIQNFI